MREWKIELLFSIRPLVWVLGNGKENGNYYRGIYIGFTNYKDPFTNSLLARA